MKKSMSIVVLALALLHISAGKISTCRITSTLWVLSTNVNEQQFKEMDTLRFCRKNMYSNSAGSADNPMLFFTKNLKQFSVTVKNSSGIYGKYTIENNKSTFHLFFYVHDPSKEGSDIINDSWNPDGDNLYTIQLASSDSLILIRKQ
jgi:hypothetical protein